MKTRVCAYPGCKTTVKKGVLACKPHWYALSLSLRDRLVHAWKQREANPDVPELVTVHRVLLVEALREWNVPLSAIREAMRSAPSVIPTACPYCGLPGGVHRVGCKTMLAGD